LGQYSIVILGFVLVSGIAVTFFVFTIMYRAAAS